MPGQRADVKELKARLDIVSIISRYVTLIKSGAGFKAKCPFHKDDTPSMTVSAEKGLWHCFGCGEGGDVIGFVMKIERLSFIETVQRLAEEVGLSFESADDGVRDELRSVMADVANLFAKNLRADAGEKARDYLSNRGYPESCWTDYGLGYALPGWDNVKRTFSRQGEEVLLKLGLLVKGDKGTYDRFRDRTIFPILDLSGRPVGFGGRTFDGEPKYLNSPQTPLFDKGRLVYGISWARDTMSETKIAVLVEGYTDVLSLHQAGITNAVGSMGTSLTQGQADLMKRFVDEVVICYDQDAA
ncbi:DNA primase, partial [Candidatus Bipolaricaulota bacterium]|nr:DNA primase [Candidatus Bipolaricaulota bacterium]